MVSTARQTDHGSGLYEGGAELVVSGPAARSDEVEVEVEPDDT